MWTPSLPHSTSWWTTSASLIRPNGDLPDPMRPCQIAKYSPSPSSPDGAASRASGISTAMRPPQRGIPHPAPAFAVQPLSALADGAHRGGSPAPGDRDGCSGASLPQALDSSAMPVRDAKRRGEGWLAGHSDIGWSNRLGWYEGFRLLVAVDPVGIITGFGFAPASAKDQSLAETFFAVRHPVPTPAWRAWDRQPADPVRDRQGFRRRREPPALDGALRDTHHPPKRNSRKRIWPRRLRRWVARIRQIASRRSTTRCSTPSVSTASGLTDCGEYRRGWQRGLLCTTSASGSMSNSVALGWLSLTCWDGDLNPHQAFKGPLFVAPAEKCLRARSKALRVACLAC
jgi:hypothetical protein